MRARLIMAGTLATGLGIAPCAAQQPAAAPEKSPTNVVKEMVKPENTVRNADGSRAPEGGPAKPTESWTSGCNPNKGDAGDRQQGCEKSEKGKEVGAKK
jgi:hypothetical protein